MWCCIAVDLKGNRNLCMRCFATWPNGWKYLFHQRWETLGTKNGWGEVVTIEVIARWIDDMIFITFEYLVEHNSLWLSQSSLWMWSSHTCIVYGYWRTLPASIHPQKNFSWKVKKNSPGEKIPPTVIPSSVKNFVRQKIILLKNLASAESSPPRNLQPIKISIPGKIPHTEIPSPLGKFLPI